VIRTRRKRKLFDEELERDKRKGEKCDKKSLKEGTIGKALSVRESKMHSGGVSSGCRFRGKL